MMLVIMATSMMVLSVIVRVNDPTQLVVAFLLLLSPNTCPLSCPSLPSATNQDEDYGKDGEDVHGDVGDNAGWFCWLHTCILC